MFDRNCEAHDIIKARNGWVANSGFDGPIFIAKSLHELADLIEGPVPVQPEYVPPHPNTCDFAVKDFDLLRSVSEYLAAGQKIKAIKALRDCGTPRLSLRAAKELLEGLFPMNGYNY